MSSIYCPYKVKGTQLLVSCAHVHIIMHIWFCVCMCVYLSWEVCKWKWFDLRHNIICSISEIDHCMIRSYVSRGSRFYSLPLIISMPLEKWWANQRVSLPAYWLGHVQIIYTLHDCIYIIIWTLSNCSPTVAAIG